MGVHFYLRIVPSMCIISKNHCIDLKPPLVFEENLKITSSLDYAQRYHSTFGLSIFLCILQLTQESGFAPQTIGGFIKISFQVMLGENYSQFRCVIENIISMEHSQIARDEVEICYKGVVCSMHEINYFKWRKPNMAIVQYDKCEWFMYLSQSVFRVPGASIITAIWRFRKYPMAAQLSNESCTGIGLLAHDSVESLQWYEVQDNGIYRHICASCISCIVYRW